MIVEKFILQLTKTWKDQRRSGHPWVEDESFYALLQPLVINEKYGSDRVFKNYQQKIHNFLQESCSLEGDKLTELLPFNLPLPLIRSKSCRHIIAIICLKDILNKSVEKLKKAEANLIDIKQVYYKPLAYLALNLKLYYELEESHPVDIFKAMQNHYEIDGMLIFTLFSNALEFITRQQIKLHCEKCYQEEEMDRQKCGVGLQEIEEDLLLWAGFDLIARGIIKPLNERVNLLLEPSDLSIEFKNIVYHPFRCYLNEREKWLEEWQQRKLAKNKLLCHPLIIPLQACPAENGWSPLLGKSGVDSEHTYSKDLLHAKHEVRCISSFELVCNELFLVQIRLKGFYSRFLSNPFGKLISASGIACFGYKCWQLFQEKNRKDAIRRGFGGSQPLQKLPDFNMKIIFAIAIAIIPAFLLFFNYRNSFNSLFWKEQQKRSSSLEEDIEDRKSWVAEEIMVLKYGEPFCENLPRKEAFNVFTKNESGNTEVYGNYLGCHLQ